MAPAQGNRAPAGVFPCPSERYVVESQLSFLSHFLFVSLEQSSVCLAMFFRAWVYPRPLGVRGFVVKHWHLHGGTCLPAGPKP